MGWHRPDSLSHRERTHRATLSGLPYRYVGAIPFGRNAALILPYKYKCKYNCRAFVGNDKVWNTVRAKR